jgi:hypothetical protein
MILRMKIAKDLRIGLTYDDRVLDNGVIARMLAEKKRREADIGIRKGASLLSAIRQKL